MASLLTKTSKVSTSRVSSIATRAISSTTPLANSGNLFFSMPSMDDHMKKHVEQFENFFFVGQPGTSRVEKGILFSAPCLSMCRNGEYYDEKSGAQEEAAPSSR